MNIKTKAALELLEKHGDAALTTQPTGVYGKRNAKRLHLNVTTARALQKRELVKVDKDNIVTIAKAKRARTKAA